ncbi:MAG TPA: DUF1697 domain-containing protein [Bacteroidales bacterium]|nr:DUF1697 domain-containing protein [Bacteroidales bacterium]
MERYISFLRGINVGGHKKILMSELKRCFEELGLKNVATYIQSGNVVFSTDEKIAPGELSKIIEHKIAESFGFEVPVIVRTYEQLQQITRKNPFLKNKMVNPEKCYVTFLSEQPLQELVNQISKLDFMPDEFLVAGHDVYLHIPDRYSDTKLSNDFFEKKLHVRATSRNWKTINTLVEMANEK